MIEETTLSLIFNTSLKNTIILLLQQYDNEILKSSNYYDLEYHHIKIRNALSQCYFDFENGRRKLTLDNRDYPNMFILMLCYGIGVNILKYVSFQEVLDSYRNVHLFIELNKLFEEDINRDFHCCCGHNISGSATYIITNKEGYNTLNGCSCIEKKKIICKEVMDIAKKSRKKLKDNQNKKIKIMRLRTLFTAWKKQYEKKYVHFYIPQKLINRIENFAKNKFQLKYDVNYWSSAKWSVSSGIHKKYFEKFPVLKDKDSFYDFKYKKEMKFAFQLI
jgi:hypothetical protein